MSNIIKISTNQEFCFFNSAEPFFLVDEIENTRYIYNPSNLLNESIIEGTDSFKLLKKSLNEHFLKPFNLSSFLIEAQSLSIKGIDKCYEDLTSENKTLFNFSMDFTKKISFKSNNIVLIEIDFFNYICEIKLKLTNNNFELFKSFIESI